VYVADNPNDHVVELSYTPQAFTGSASNVTVQNLIVEKYATPFETGVIEPHGPGWTVQSDTIRLNSPESRRRD
jgi:hypothetical protein